MRLGIKAINDATEMNRIGPSTLVFETTMEFTAAPASNMKQTERLKALRAARDEMANIIAEKRINDALLRKLPPSTNY